MINAEASDYNHAPVKGTKNKTSFHTFSLGFCYHVNIIIKKAHDIKDSARSVETSTLQLGNNLQ